MSKAYPSNLTLDQYEMLSDLIPEPKPGGRPRTVDTWEVLNAIFYILVEGVRWRALAGDFPPWQTVYTYFRNWRKDGSWVKLHDSLRDWVRIDAGRNPHPCEASIDSQSVKTAAGVHEAVGYDAGKQIKGRKRFTMVDTLGLLLGARVMAASVGEREGGKQLLQRVKQRGRSLTRLHTIWVDGGFDGEPFLRWVMDVCRWIVQWYCVPRAAKGLFSCPSVGWSSAPLVG